MDRTEKLIEIDNLVLDLGVSHNKARKMGNVIANDYYDLDDDSCKLAFFDMAGVLHNILTDYLFESDALLKKIREILDEEETGE